MYAGRGGGRFFLTASGHYKRLGPTFWKRRGDPVRPYSPTLVGWCGLKTRFVNTGNPGFPEPWLSEIRRRRGKHPRIFFIFSVCFLFFQPEDFGKLSAGLPHFLGQFRAPGTNIRPISFHFSVFFSFRVAKKYENQSFAFYFQMVRPRNNAQSLDLAARILGKKNSSVQQNLADLVKKQVFNCCGSHGVDDNQGSR